MTEENSQSRAFEGPPDSRTLDLFLDDYERELHLREASDRELGPVVERLRRALERWEADGSAFEEVRDSRSAYVSKLSEWQDLWDHKTRIALI